VRTVTCGGGAWCQQRSAGRLDPRTARYADRATSLQNSQRACSRRAAIGYPTGLQPRLLQSAARDSRAQECRAPVETTQRGASESPTESPRYGLAIQQYEAMIKAQENRAICGNQPDPQGVKSASRLHVDQTENGAVAVCFVSVAIRASAISSMTQPCYGQQRTTSNVTERPHTEGEPPVSAWSIPVESFSSVTLTSMLQTGTAIDLHRWHDHASIHPRVVTNDSWSVSLQGSSRRRGLVRHRRDTAARKAEPDHDCGCRNRHFKPARSSVRLVRSVGSPTVTALVTSAERKPPDEGEDEVDITDPRRQAVAGYREEVDLPTMKAKTCAPRASPSLSWIRRCRSDRAEG